MQREEEIQLLKELLGLKQDKTFFLDEYTTSNPVNDYLESDRFENEQKHIFNRMPVIIAHASELDQANSYLRRTVNGKPLLLMRGDDNEIRAFLNVCRHRGTRLVDSEQGCKQRHSCPYHAWTWNSRGEFVTAPHLTAGFPNIEKPELALKSLPTTVRHGFVWLLPENHEENLAQFLGEIDSMLAWAGTEQMTVHKSELQRRQCNWKLLVEGGIEAYHFRIAHRKTIAALFNDNLSSYQCFGPHIRSILPRASIESLPHTPTQQWAIREHANVLLNVFPSSSFLIQSDHVIWIAMNPISVDTSEIRLMTLKPVDSQQPQEYWDKNHQLTVTTLDEDFTIGESIQSGLDSGANDSLLFGRFEGALQRFNNTVRSYLPAD